jgi:hypothetical protein
VGELSSRIPVAVKEDKIQEPGDYILRGQGNGSQIKARFSRHVPIGYDVGLISIDVMRTNKIRSSIKWTMGKNLLTPFSSLVILILKFIKKKTKSKIRDSLIDIS